MEIFDWEISDMKDEITGRLSTSEKEIKYFETVWGQSHFFKMTGIVYSFNQSLCKLCKYATIKVIKDFKGKIKWVLTIKINQIAD